MTELRIFKTYTGVQKRSASAQFIGIATCSGYEVWLLLRVLYCKSIDALISPSWPLSAIHK